MRIKYYIVPLFVASCLLMCACSGKRAFVRKMEGQNLTAGLSQPGKTVDTTVVDVPREVRLKSVLTVSLTTVSVSPIIVTNCAWTVMASIQNNSASNIFLIGY